MEQIKKCPKCKQELPRTSFTKNTRSADGLRSWCKGCNNASSNAWRKANPEKRRAYGVTWRKANKEECRAYGAAWRKENPEKQRALSASWYVKNRDKTIVRSRTWEKANPEKRRTNHAAWEKANPEKRRASRATYYVRNREKVLSKSRDLRKANPERYKKYAANYRTNLTEHYIRRVLLKRMPLKVLEIPPSLIGAKRQQLKVKRLIKEKSNERSSI